MSANNVVVCVWIQEKGSIKEDIEVAVVVSIVS